MAAAAPAAGKGKRKRHLSEDDVCLLQRYNPGTILTALQEVAQHAEGRIIDWRAVVAKSATGITSAREYQMLWRYLAYHHDLNESIEAGDLPLGDDSDLELELEPNPSETKEALSEASALAKALISRSSREQASGHRINLDVPALNTQNEKIVRVPSKQLAQSHRVTNVTCPVSNPKQLSHIVPSPTHLDPNGASKKRKKAKAWSKEEDADLAAGVQKYGEGNWEVILHKCNFDNTRTPDQLSQRWALKRPGGSTKPASTKHASVGSEERSATIKALHLAVGPMPVSSALRSGREQSIQHKSTAFAPKMPQVRSAVTPSLAPALALPVQPLRVAAEVQSPLRHGQQAPGQGVSAVNQSGPPAGAETKKALGTTLAPVPCDSEENEDGSEFCAITLDDLFPEDAKQPETVDTKAKQPETTGPKAKQPENADPKAMHQETMDPKSKQPDTLKVGILDPKDKDMLEFDQYVASQGAHLNTDDLNKSKCTNSASQAQGLVGSQKNPLKLTPVDGKANPVTAAGRGKPVAAGVASTGKKATIPISHLAAGTPRGIVDTVNANAPIRRTLTRRAAALVPAGCQAPPPKHAIDAKGCQMTNSIATFVSSGVPASSQASTPAKDANKASPPSSSCQPKPDSVAVNGAIRAVKSVAKKGNLPAAAARQ
uniref:Homeodomain-like superfamily protein n=1 Tax=Zea mays TaxID=4577 RepID=A0A804PIP8_MAIZE